MKAATSPEAFDILEDSKVSKDLDKIFSELKTKKEEGNQKVITIDDVKYNVRIARSVRKTRK